jgi:hypothetical protein
LQGVGLELDESDANTALFRLHAQHRKRKIFIARIVEGNQILTAHEDKAKAILDFDDGPDW